MRLLFAITIFSFCAVMWVALALARRIRRSQIMQTKSAMPPDVRPVEELRSPANRQATSRIAPHRPVAQEFFEAGEFRTPRPLRLEQEIFQQKPRLHLAEITFTSEAPAPAMVHPVPAPQQANVQRPSTPQPSPAPIPIRSAPAFASLFGQNVPIARITEVPPVVHHLRTSEPEILSPVNDTAVSQAAPVSLPLPFTLHRKPPQTARSSGLRSRIDLSRYNKDMGDLTDPYTNHLRGSGTQGPIPADRANR